MNAVDFKLDYFQIYDLKNPIDLSKRREATRIIELKGQFDQAHEKARVESLDKFADRVSKNKEELYDPRAHLTWYSLYYPPDAPGPIRRRVQVINQFKQEHEQVLEIHRVIGLLVPAGKRWEKDAKKEKVRLFSISAKLDHYKIYEVIEGRPVDQYPVRLEDQFCTREVRVYQPVWFAVPVWKKHGRRVFDILNKKAHLTIYKVDEWKLGTAIETRDQFLSVLKGNIVSPGGVILGVSRYLAVPTEKLDWKEG